MDTRSPHAIYAVSAITPLAAMAVWMVGAGSLAPPTRNTAQFTWSLPHGMTLGSELVVSPDGGRVAFVGVGDSGSRLFVRDLAKLEALPLPGTTGAKQPFGSPDGKAVAFFANGRLMKMAPDGGEPVELAAAPDARGGSWSGSGVIVFQPFFRDRGLVCVSANGGEVQAATLLDVTSDDTTHKWPVFLPDGDHFLYLVLSVDENRRASTWGVFRRGRRCRPRAFFRRCQACPTSFQRATIRDSCYRSRAARFRRDGLTPIGRLLPGTHERLG